MKRTHLINDALTQIRPEVSASNQTNSPPSAASLFILGNGHRCRIVNGTPKLEFNFNSHAPNEPTGNRINVRMTRDSLGDHRVALEANSSPAEIADLEQQLNDMLDQQVVALGCLPSTGYALVHGLWPSHQGVVIDGMWFNPSLVRTADLSPRKPLPQAFHNWLGERRTTFQRWLTEPPMNWSWPMIDGLDIKSTPANAAPTQRCIQHAQLLEAMTEAARTGSMFRLEDMAETSIAPSPELLKASTQTTQLEQMFHLNRTQSDTHNWWLFDAQASALIEQIAQRLRLAQYLAFNHTALRQVAAD